MKSCAFFFRGDLLLYSPASVFGQIPQPKINQFISSSSIPRNFLQCRLSLRTEEENEDFSASFCECSHFFLSFSRFFSISTQNSWPSSCTFLNLPLLLSHFFFNFFAQSIDKVITIKR